MSRFIYIGREGFRVENEAHFANILEEKLGRDAADLFREYLNGYRATIDCALDELERITCTNSATNDAYLDEAMASLRRAL